MLRKNNLAMSCCKEQAREPLTKPTQSMVGGCEPLNGVFGKTPNPDHIHVFRHIDINSTQQITFIHPCSVCTDTSVFNSRNGRNIVASSIAIVKVGIKKEAPVRFGGFTSGKEHSWGRAVKDFQF